MAESTPRDCSVQRRKKATDVSEQGSSSSTATTPAATATVTATAATATLIASLAHPGQLLTSISPEFLKKVEVWERLKSGLAVATPPPLPPPLPSESAASGATAVNAHSKRINDSPEWKDREGSLHLLLLLRFTSSISMSIS